MNKLTRLAAALGSAEIKLNQNLFGAKMPWAKLDETQLQAVETALEASQNADAEATIEGLNDQLASLQEDFINLHASFVEIETAIANALQITGLKSLDNHAQSIGLLATKCKEFGASKNRHSFAENNGEQTTDENNAWFNADAAHNQID